MENPIKRMLQVGGLAALIATAQPSQAKEPVKVLDNSNTNTSSYNIKNSSNTFPDKMTLDEYMKSIKNPNYNVNKSSYTTDTSTAPYVTAKSTTTLEDEEKIEPPKKTEKSLMSVIGDDEITEGEPVKKKGLVDVVKNLIGRFSIGYGIENNYCDPMKDFYSGMNENWKDGVYTFDGIIPDFNDMPSPKDLILKGAELSFNLINGKKLKININYGRANGSQSVPHYEGACNVDYSKFGQSSTYITIQRDENYNLDKASLGLGLDFEIVKKLMLGIGINAEAYTINGAEDLEWHRPDTTYTQWRDATFSGQGNGIDGKLKLTYTPIRNISIEGNVGCNRASIQTTGKEIRHNSSNSIIGELDYSPNFKLNNLNAGIKAKIRF